MPEDPDSRILDEMARDLTARDPAFVARMTGAAPCAFPTLSVLGVLLFLGLPMASLLFGGTGSLVTVLGYALAVTVVLTHRHRHG